MLSILWVEDEITDAKQIAWFGERRIKKEIDFTKAKETINSCLEQFDLIILDINLENSEQSREVQDLAKKFNLTDKAFLQESGMNLYFNLLERGFPKKQIIFLTANADDNLSQIDELCDALARGAEVISNEILEDIHTKLGDEEIAVCKGYLDKGDDEGLCQYLKKHFNNLSYASHQATYNRYHDALLSHRIEVPNAINKDLNTSKQHLSRWLDSHENKDYLVLRRGIIEGCNYLKRFYERDEEKHLFNEYIKYFDKRVDLGGVLDYLEVLEKYLPLREPDDKFTLYKLFVRTLAHEWEAVDSKLIGKNSKINGQYAFAWTMKITRNWTMHSKIFERLMPQDVAYLFLVNMRAMFNLGDEVLAYERQLLSLFTKPLSEHEMKTKIGDPPWKPKDINYSKRQIPLVENYAALLRKAGKTKQAINYHYALNDLQKDLQKNKEGSIEKDFYITGLYQIFWFLTSKGNITIPDEKRIKGFPSLAYTFYYFDYQPKCLFEIARHIYNRSFAAKH